MSAVAIGLWSAVAGLGAWVAARKGPTALRRAGIFALGQASALVIRLPLALLAAAFLSQIIPTEHVASVLGPQSGPWGIVIASLIGGIMPGGPMTSFPLALVVFQAGAGPAQTVALLAGWSVFALHRVRAYEAPMMGWRFSALRLAACFFLPPLTGLLATLAMQLGGFPGLGP